MLVVWTPLLRSDSKAAAQQATAYLADSRVVHYWDLWSYFNRTYAKQFGLPVPEAWDLFILYGSGTKWGESAPEPDIWMQHRNLDTGIPYTQDKLEKALLELLP